MLKTIISKINIQSVNILFITSLTFIFISYILFAEGLAEEGVKNLYNIIITNKLIFLRRAEFFFISYINSLPSFL